MALRPRCHNTNTQATSTDDKALMTVSDKARSKAEANKAVKIARDSKGVSSVKNEIAVQTN